MNTDEELVKQLLSIAKLYGEFNPENTQDIYYLSNVDYYSDAFVLLPLKEEDIHSDKANALADEIDKLLVLDEQTLERCIQLALEASWTLRHRVLPDDGYPATEERKAQFSYITCCIAVHLLRRMGTSENATMLKQTLNRIHPRVPHMNKEFEHDLHHSSIELKDLLRTMLDLTRKMDERMDYQLPYKKEYVEFVDKWCSKYPQLWQHAVAYWRDRNTSIPTIPIN